MRIYFVDSPVTDPDAIPVAWADSLALGVLPIEVVDEAGFPEAQKCYLADPAVEPNTLRIYRAAEAPDESIGAEAPAALPGTDHPGTRALRKYCAWGFAVFTFVIVIAAALHFHIAAAVIVCDVLLGLIALGLSLSLRRRD